jgi:hypothetical protein
MDREPLLDVTMPNSVDSEILDSHFN